VTPLQFILPGDIGQRTGGYLYDARLVQGLRAAGRTVHVHELPDDFPQPEAATRRSAAACYDALPEGALVLSDALAGSALPEIMAAQRDRVRLIALVHHPLALETGLDTASVARLASDERAALACARHVVCTSAATATALQDYDVAPDDITVAEPGTDPAALAAGREIGEPLRFLCVATLTPRKAHDVLIEAFATLHREHPTLAWRLDLVGSATRSPATTAALRAAIERHGLGERVTLHGEQEAEALRAHYHSADVFVLASRHEGFGMVLHEALARGLPIVATRGGAIADTVPEGAGLLVPVDAVPDLANALHRVATDDACMTALRDGARAARDRLPRWRDTVQRVDAVLQQVDAR